MLLFVINIIQLVCLRTHWFAFQLLFSQGCISTVDVSTCIQMLFSQGCSMQLKCIQLLFSQGCMFNSCRDVRCLSSCCLTNCIQIWSLELGPWPGNHVADIETTTFLKQINYWGLFIVSFFAGKGKVSTPKSYPRVLDSRRWCLKLLFTPLLYKLSVWIWSPGLWVCLMFQELRLATSSWVHRLQPQWFDSESMTVPILIRSINFSSQRSNSHFKMSHSSFPSQAMVLLLYLGIPRKSGWWVAVVRQRRRTLMRRWRWRRGVQPWMATTQAPRRSFKTIPTTTSNRAYLGVTGHVQELRQGCVIIV